VRLLTLIGTGGIGKTRLAVQVASDLAHDYANSVCFVSLAPISDSNLVIPTIAQALGFGETEDLSLFEHLKASLYEKQFLLLLDNFEQVAAAAPLVAELLAACPQVKIVVTSREALRIYGEYEFPVPPLALPDPKHLPEITYLSHYAAIALFIQRAQAIKPDFHMTDTTARAIAEICIRLDGLPLAIELAAARIKLLPPEILLTRLKRRLHVLISGTRDAPERHQTLRNTMKWSYDLLNADEQRLFRELGNKRGIALSLLQLAELLFAAQGDQTRVRSLLEEGFALCRDLGDKDAIAYSYSFSGQVALSEGDAFTIILSGGPCPSRHGEE
jgi:predicted ATPase